MSFVNMGETSAAEFEFSPMPLPRAFRSLDGTENTPEIGAMSQSNRKNEGGARRCLSDGGSPLLLEGFEPDPRDAR
jgi:hypothetical protein